MPWSAEIDSAAETRECILIAGIDEGATTPAGAEIGRQKWGRSHADGLSSDVTAHDTSTASQSTVKGTPPCDPRGSCARHLP